MQLPEAAGPASALDVAVALGLVLCVAFGEGVGLGLALGLELEVALAVSLGVALPLTLALLLVLAVLVLAEDFVLVVAVAVAERTCAARDELAVEDGHEVGVVVTVCPPDVITMIPPPPNGLPALPVLVDAVGVLGGMNPTAWPISVRIGGTAASITPTANTAKPTAKAGRSMASRQSRGRCACRGLAGLARWAPGAVCPWRSAYQPRASAAFQRRIMSASTLTAAARPRVSRNLPALA